MDITTDLVIEETECPMHSTHDAFDHVRKIYELMYERVKMLSLTEFGTNFINHNKYEKNPDNYLYMFTDGYSTELYAEKTRRLQYLTKLRTKLWDRLRWLEDNVTLTMYEQLLRTSE